ncbi:hypothetical protein [Sporolactobacillus terrae]|uniref:hypothetical protein n=1 Tax=Sporolactobacillus terrae TaxID=269673 RepID=UPI00111AD997|nr:hypothetical protein [Sporolactobacillus terrae]
MADYDTPKTEPIVLGMGELYIGTVDNPESKTDEEIIPLLKNVGTIESGAELQYSIDIQDVTGGNRNGVLARIITNTDVQFTTGIMTWSLDNLAAVSPSTITVDGTTGTKTVKFGDQKLPTNYLRFVHPKEDGGEIIVNIAKVQNTGGFTFSFSKEDPTVVALEFHALRQNDGTLLEIIETFPVTP